MSEYITSYFNHIANGVKSFISGLVLTFDHMKNKKDNVATLQYPHEKFPVAEKKIGFEHSEYNVIRSRLHVDIDDCISCGMCERACPVDCIKIEDVKPKKDIEFDCGKTSNETQKKLLVTRFTIDMSECMYCNLCVYPCPEECIYMVGGPNESKHEIDYEFSQYKRDGMIFEFANTSDEDLMTVGAEDYLKKKKEKQEKIIEGERLLGIKTESTPQPTVDSAVDTPTEVPEAAPVAGGIDNLTIKCIDFIDDLKLRAAAKKMFFKSKKAGEDDVTKIDKIIIGIKNVDGFNSDLEQKLIALKPAVSQPAPEIAATKVVPEETTVADQESKRGLFDIKLLNDIEDVATRASLKKIYMGAKKDSKNSDEVIPDMINALESKGKLTDKIKSLLDGILK